ncbi:FMN-binding protein [Cryobacterium sp. Sr8]|uniref:FMN-binding protein n=1 Tax=Cryobacterium sp. Sr8 TaxID=1259203 RepID=UPI00106C1030|nr:FMN-binding protein [Cryobacterium sp. Sr8]TFD80346.1 FMN-binding protein [Cryobacterium sp. Sr8]
MRKRASAFAALASVAVLAAGWELGVQAGVLSPAGTAAGTSDSSGAASRGGAPAAAAPAAAAAPSGTFTGSAVQTRFGPVQVSVTIAGGAITDVTALRLTDRDGKSVAISNRAAPVLREEVLSAQSASVQNIGGATYTTEGYLQSLQSALDAANF